jgi:UPF0755 protein
MKFRLIAAFALSTVVVSWYFFFLANAPVQIQPPVTIEIEAGTTARETVSALARHGVVRNERVMQFLVRMSGLDREIRFGEHVFKGAMTPERVIEELIRSPRPTRPITIAEGLTLYQVADLLDEAELADAAAYRRAACDHELLGTLGVPAESNCAEGYLFPDTYNLTPGMTAEAVVRLQIQRFRQVMAELSAEVRRAQQAEGDAQGPILKLHDTVVVASIIEKETALSDERPLVSSVFHNRLDRGMRLQADPTVIYGLQVTGTPWDGTQLHMRLREPSPYNTYTSDGLPPGPICNPGRESLAAALTPQATDFLYFVAKGDGSHRFSVTLAQHNQAVAKLRRQ